MRKYYTTEFYEGLEQGSHHSALAVLGLLYRLYKPQSVVDVGCGRGSWLAAAENLGSVDLFGLDGDWVDPAQLMSPNIVFKKVDLERSLPDDRRFDLCMCLEVAEHLSSNRSESFIQSLCALSDVIIFSAAIPSQGGVNHVNEQWQSHWIGIFRSNGFKCFDLFRPKLWGNESIDWWYRQNLFLFVMENTELEFLMNKMNSDVVIPDIVHPLNQANKQYWNRKRIDELEQKVKAASCSAECLPLVAQYFKGSQPKLARYILELATFSEKKHLK
jgi:SAM-dependent methyltransferase